MPPVIPKISYKDILTGEKFREVKINFYQPKLQLISPILHHRKSPSHVHFFVIKKSYREKKEKRCLATNAHVM